MELQTLKICNKFTNKLDNHGIGDQVFHATQVLDKVQAVHDKIVDTLSSMSTLLLNKQSPTVYHSPAAAGEKENANVFVVGEVEGKEAEEITITALIYDYEEHEAVPLAVKKPKGLLYGTVETLPTTYLHTDCSILLTFLPLEVADKSLT
eukprot:13623445-Ditylum_brightwellii.AAC.1